MTHTQIDINNAVNKIVNEFTGKKTAFPNGAYLGECTAPIVHLLAELDIPVPSMANDRADGWGVSFPAALAPYFTHEKFQMGKRYPKGTLLLWNSPHIAIVLSCDGDNTVEVFEQNADPDHSPCGSKTRLVNNEHRQCTYALVPRVAAPQPAVAPSAPKPTPVPTPAPQPAPAAPASVESQPAQHYTVTTSVPGYRTSNDAANHIESEFTVEVPVGTYYVFNTANGMVNVTRAEGTAGAWINPADNKEPAAAPAEPPKPKNIEYTKLAEPMELLTNKQPTHIWDLGFHDDAHATSVMTLDQGTPFVAYGRAQRIDLDRPCYFMTKEDFGNADVDGTPVHNQGINTVDLSESPKPAPETSKTVDIKVVDNSGMPEPEEEAAAPAEAADAPETPETPPEPPVVASPGAPKGVVFTAFMNPMAYVVNADVTVQDYADEQKPIKVASGTPVMVGGTFIADGSKYYRAQSSIDKGTWYGFPVTSLRKQTDAAPIAPSPNTFDDIDQIGAEVSQIMHKEKTSAHDRALRVGGTAEGWIIRLLRLLHLVK